MTLTLEREEDTNFSRVSKSDFPVSSIQYKPTPIDTFSIGVDKNIGVVQAFSTLPISLYQPILEFTSNYSSLESAVFCERFEPQRYGVFVGYCLKDILWICSAMNRFENGWKIYGFVAISPINTEVKLQSILDAIVSLKKDSESFNQSILILEDVNHDIVSNN